MTELTLDKQIKQFPSVNEFVDAQGDELYFGADGDLFFLKHECRIWKHFFSHISIPGLRPKPRKVKKILKHWAHIKNGKIDCFFSTLVEATRTLDSNIILVEFTGEYEIEE